MSTVAVIGGGVTGLVAALRLKEQGAAVTVYESSGTPGGVIRTVKSDGWVVDAGPNTILETSPELTRLVADLGLIEDRVYAQPEARNRYIARGGRPLPLPTSAGAFLKTSLFSTAAKLRLMREPFIRRGTAEDETVADFVRRRIGQEFLDYAINPFVAGIFAGDPERLSVRHAFPKLREVEARWGSLIRGQFLGARERRRRGEVSKASAPMFSFHGGLSVLPDALHKALFAEMLVNTTVTGLERRDGNWVVKAQSGESAYENSYDAVLVAMPAWSVAALAGAASGGRPSAPALAPLVALDQVPHPPVATVSLGFRRDDVAHLLDGYGVLVPAVEDHGILGALFVSTIFPGRAPAGHVLLTCFLGGTRSPATARLPQDEAVALALRDLDTLLGLRGEPVFVHHDFYDRAIPQLEVGHDRFLDLVAAVEAHAPGLFFAGNYRGETSLAGAIRNGTAAAARIGAATAGAGFPASNDDTVAT